jgi:hypothetical protein
MAPKALKFQKVDIKIQRCGYECKLELWNQWYIPFHRSGALCPADFTCGIGQPRNLHDFPFGQDGTAFALMFNATDSFST